MKLDLGPAFACCLAAVVLGCGPGARPASLYAREALAVMAAQPDEQAELPACTDEAPFATNDGVTVELECKDGHRHCSVRLPVALRNCTAEPVAVQQLVFRNDWESTAMLVEFDPLQEVPAGQAWQRRQLISRDREFEVEIVIVLADGSSGSVGMRATVRNPNREEAMARCRECDGDWGRHGLLGREGCLCRARDRGSECRDGRDCEGVCLFERAETVREASESCGSGFCNVRLEMVLLVGRCSEFVTEFGCHSYLPDGIAGEGPLPAYYPVPYICCD
jgi:hypothetical protein